MYICIYYHIYSYICYIFLLDMYNLIFSLFLCYLKLGLAFSRKFNCQNFWQFSAADTAMFVARWYGFLDVFASAANLHCRSPY